MVTTCLVQFQLCKSDAFRSSLSCTCSCQENLWSWRRSTNVNGGRKEYQSDILYMRNVSPVFILVTKSRRTEAAGFWSCVENVFCKVAAPRRYIGNILDQHVNVMQKYLEVAPNRRVQCECWTINLIRAKSPEVKLRDGPIPVWVRMILSHGSWYETARCRGFTLKPRASYPSTSSKRMGSV